LTARTPGLPHFSQAVRAAGSLAATATIAGFFHGLFDRVAGFARAFLNPAHQFFLLAFRVLEIVIGKLGPFLFQFAFGNVPVAFDFKFRHNVYFRFGCLLWFAVGVTAKVIWQRLTGYDL
jgi:hypothetical protein